MLNLKFFTVAAAALTLVSGVDAAGYPIKKRNQEPDQPSCTDFTPFKYAGCFQDPSNPGRALLFDGPSNDNMTVETCVAFCKGLSSRRYFQFHMSNCVQETTTNMLVWNTIMNVTVGVRSTVPKSTRVSALFPALETSLRLVVAMTTSASTKIPHSLSWMTQFTPTTSP